MRIAGDGRTQHFSDNRFAPQEKWPI
jgi:hypothetical protein